MLMEKRPKDLDQVLKSRRSRANTYRNIGVSTYVTCVFHLARGGTTQSGSQEKNEQALDLTVCTQVLALYLYRTELGITKISSSSAYNSYDFPTEDRSKVGK